MLTVFLPTLLHEFRQLRIVIRRIVHDIFPKFCHQSHLILIGKLRETWKTFDDHGMKLLHQCHRVNA